MDVAQVKHKDWATSGLQDQHARSSTGPFSIFAGLNYHLFALNTVGLEDQLQ